MGLRCQVKRLCSSRGPQKRGSSPFSRALEFQSIFGEVIKGKTITQRDKKEKDKKKTPIE